jgi:hypothetical protein
MYVLHRTSPPPFFPGEIYPKSDETLPTTGKKKKTKAPKKGGIQGTKWKDPHPRRQMNLPLWDRQTTREKSSSQTPFGGEKHINQRKGRTS